MQVIDTIVLPTSALFSNHRDLDNFCRSVESLGFEVFHDIEIDFHKKMFISYDFVNKIVLVR